MSTQMILRVDSEIKEKLSKLARREGKTASQVVRELIEGYIQDKDIGTYVDDLWGRVEASLRSKKVTRKDIAKAVKAVRRERAVKR
ncbi:MAG TPA: ribbon-helix-helix protein, CopG family [Candidatus Manganitrophaceae bacterium]|nr:ribbon-helix-helix protein, CopG family [Candidatus Manganitrophaceae bacterium]